MRRTFRLGLYEPARPVRSEAAGAARRDDQLIVSEAELVGLPAQKASRGALRGATCCSG
jgi:hypothetical protein